MKRILILGAGIYQVPLIKKAKEMGLKTIVVSIAGNYPGFEVSDKVYYEDTKNIDKLLEIAKKEKIAGVLTTGTDVAVGAVGAINDAFGLRGCSYEAARLACDKYLMKDAFINKGVPTATYQIAHLDIGSEDIEKICKEIGYPVIFKALDSSGSRGITVVNSSKDFKKAVDVVRGVTRQQTYIIEKYLEGLEFGAQAFIQNGEIEFVLPHGDYVFYGDTGVPVGHFAPLEDVDNNEVMKVSKAAIKALHIDNCAVNMDYILSDGKIYMLEVGARCGATQLAELVSIYYGFDYYEKMIEVAIGQKALFECQNTKTPNASHVLMSEKSGVITNISNNASEIPGVVEIQFDYNVGDRVRKFHVGPDRMGHVITKGKTLEEANKALGNALDMIQIAVKEDEG